MLASNREFEARPTGFKLLLFLIFCSLANTLHYFYCCCPPAMGEIFLYDPSNHSNYISTPQLVKQDFMIWALLFLSLNFWHFSSWILWCHIKSVGILHRGCYDDLYSLSSYIIVTSPGMSFLPRPLFCAHTLQVLLDEDLLWKGVPDSSGFFTFISGNCDCEFTHKPPLFDGQHMSNEIMSRLAVNSHNLSLHS